MTRQKLKALLSRFSSYPVFNISSTVWIFAPEGILYTQYLFLYHCSAFLLFQDRLVWYCRGIWSREEDQPTQCLVSHCQCWCPPGSHPQNQVLSTGQLIVVIVMIFTKGWLFMDVLLSHLRLARASQNYLFPIHLTDQLLPSAIFYATVGPLLAYMAIHRLIVIPYTKAQKEESVFFSVLPHFIMMYTQHCISPQ